MKEINLTHEQVTLVDDEDYERLNKFKWYVNTEGYAIHSVYCVPPIKFRMHRLIVNAPKGVDVDHIDGNKLNNQKSNLRICNRSQNTANSKKYNRGLSKYKGVRLLQNGHWKASITPCGKYINLGSKYLSEEEAATAYNVAAIEHFGKFARINIIERKGRCWR